MRRCTFCLALMMFLLAACAPQPAADSANSETAPAATTAESASTPPSGRWSGDYGPNADRREPITVELRWEDGNLRGTVLAGARELELTNASFKPETGAIVMEFDAQGNNGQIVHYTIEGKVAGDTMEGTWSHSAMRGDFQVTRRDKSF